MNEPNPKYESKLKIYRYSTLIYVILAVVATAAAFIAGAKEESRYLSDTIFTYLFYGFIALSSIFAISAIFGFKGHGISHGERGESSRAPILSSLLGAGAICLIITRIAEIVKKAGGSTATVFDVLIILTAVFVVIYSLSELIPIGESLTLISGYFQIILCILIISEFYLDHSVEMNAPIKLLAQFALASVILGTLSDLRILIGRSHAGLYLFTKICAILIPIVSTVASIIEILTAPEEYTVIYLVASLFTLSYAIPSLVKLMKARVVKTENNEPDPESDRPSVGEAIDKIITETVSDDNDTNDDE